MIIEERNRISLNPMAEPYARNGERCSRDDVSNNNNKEQEWKTFKNGTKEKI